MRILGIILVLVLGLVIWQGVSFYQSILESPNKLEEKAKGAVGLSEVDETIHYHGTNGAYVVFKGKNEDGEAVYTWVPEKKGSPVTKKEDEGVASNVVKSNLNDRFSPTEIISIKPGIEVNQDGQEVLVWEATFVDDQDRYTFAYYYFSNGEYWRSRSIRQS
ncbi:cell wall elongation regulator TseB-like domain-containing protein [Alkalihalobacillus sp. CinArs1]|uniref:cell wall elongation regulator TseB-like domain-containing protein n=1 Tax=Alkalihalobacillus sp. CinArs1 TaxID=2995314 RepID=UPI0022DD1A0E|nr:DUF5590 domain-containing protein [Alkalihalobacillus sp. CinArs1]